MNQTRQSTRRTLTHFHVVSILLLLAFCASPETAQGQWTTGTNISNTNTGNVGIGTSTPNGKLDVVGASGAPNALTGLTGVLRVGTSNEHIEFGYVTGRRTWLQSFGAVPLHINEVGNNVIFNLGGGNIGIGTTAPANQLHVHNSSGSASMRVSGAGAGVLNFIDSNAAANAKLFQWRSEGGLFRMSLVNDAESAYVQQNLLVVNPSGNVGIGMTPTAANKLEVLGSLNVSGTIRGGIIEAKYQDVAEWVESSQKLEAGTVVTLDPEKSNRVLASSEAYDTKVAGVVSAQPGISLGERGEGKVLVATTGRVRVKVNATRAPIKIGDLLVTSDVAGVAMKSMPVDVSGAKFHRPGTLIGKALEPLATGTSEILVLLSLQ
jgi:hypothetical protein